MNWFLLIAAILSVVTWAIHVFAGRAFVVKPLLEAGLRDLPKYTAYYCWHIVSIVLGMMAIGFFLGAVNADARDVALIMTIMAAMFFAWSLALISWKRQPLRRLPQWALFLPIAAFGFLGSWL